MIPDVLILSRRDIAALMRPRDYLEAVEAGFLAAATGRADTPAPMHMTAEGGAFHAKGSALAGDDAIVALKLNGNFPGNPQARGLPTIQGAILLCDAETGSLLAVMDSIEITLRRTAAASALAARLFASPDAHTLTICGCGDQGRAHAEAMSQVREFTCGFAWDSDRDKAERFAKEMSAALGFEFSAVDDLASAARASDVIATCTTARTSFLGPDDVSPGAFVAAVGADNPDKTEIAPALMAKARIVADVAGQCAQMGDLRAAVAAGVMAPDGIYAELGEVLAGKAKGRVSEEDIYIFDSTGAAFQDAASARIAYRRAMETGAGLRLNLAGL